MAIITKTNVQKGAEVEFTLNIPQLLQHEVVLADAYFLDQSNWDKVVLSYASVPGLQKEHLIFNNVDSGNSSVSYFGVSEKARDSFFVKSITIIDKQGGFLIIKRNRLIVANFDIHLGAQPAVFTGFDSAISLDDAEINILTEIQSDMVALNSKVSELEHEISIDDSVKSLNLNNDEQISLSAFARKQMITLTGNNASVVLNDLAFSNVPSDASEIILVGGHDTNTVTVKHNDSDNGLLINGDATLSKGQTLTLIYNQSLLRFVEISRSF